MSKLEDVKVLMDHEYVGLFSPRHKMQANGLTAGLYNRTLSMKLPGYLGITFTGFPGQCSVLTAYNIPIRPERLHHDAILEVAKLYGYTKVALSTNSEKIANAYRRWGWRSMTKKFTNRRTGKDIRILYFDVPEEVKSD